MELCGALCTAFVNTAAARPKNNQQGVENYADLLTWSQQTHLLGAAEAERLRQRADEHPEEAEAAYQRAARLRHHLSRLFVAVATERELPIADLTAFNKALGEASAHLCLVPGEVGVVWGWTGDGDALDRMLWPVLHSAAELLVSIEGKPAIRQCAAKTCRLWFVDRTRSRQRRWCDMKLCGNRQKALRHYYRSGRSEREEHMRGRLGLWKARRPRERTEI